MNRVTLFALLLTPPLLAADPPKPDAAGYDKAVKGFVAAHCVKCHGGDKPQGKFDVTKLSADVSKNDGLDAWAKVAERLSAGEMPPADEKQPDLDAIKGVTDWVGRELGKAGKTVAVKPGSLRTGNHVPHAALFGPDAGKVALDSPPRVWRVSPFIYDEFAKQFKGLKLAQPFSPPPGDRFKDQANGGAVDESTAATILRNAETIADEQLGISGRKVGNKKANAALAPLLTDKPTAAEVEKAVAYQFDLVLKRKPTAAEVGRFGTLYADTRKLGEPDSAARAVLVAVLVQPEATFRSEAGENGRLTPREVAFALAYALTDKAPDADLLKAADAGRLSTAEQIGGQVARLFESSKTDKPRVLRFFREYFGYATATEVFKDAKEFPTHNARAWVEDTDRLILDVLAKDENVFVELLTTTKSYVGHKGTEAAKKKIADTLKSYEADKAKNPDKAKAPPKVDKDQLFLVAGLTDFPETQPVDLPKGQRAGVLTQPAWLVAYSENDGNHAIKRGKWVRERLLGGTVPDIPITVDAQLPDAPHKTLRERMTVTQEKYCWQCHQKMNDIGLLFEQFDHYGRHRTTETVRVEGKPDAKGKPTPPVAKEVPLDTTGKVAGTGVKGVDGDYPDAVTMIRTVASTDFARQVFVRHAFRYWMGRDENLGDARTLQAADAAFVTSGGSMKALITALLTSESFLYRTTAK